jgi:hypothetical protein
MDKIATMKIGDAETREKALQVIEGVYLKEKNWIRSPEKEIPEGVQLSTRVSWFLATEEGKPAGVLRIIYDPPLALSPELKVTLREGFDPVQIASAGRYVDIGRFMILPAYRKNILVAMGLMQMAIREVVERDYTHFITDVFEGEVHSPLHFHTKILGFEVIGSHLHGELNCSLTRIILTMDILKAYQRLKARRNRLYWLLSQGVRDILDKKLTASMALGK